MSIPQSYTNIALDELAPLAHSKKAAGARFVQILAVRTDEGADVIYTFMENGTLCNYILPAVTKDTVVPSISDDFFSAFVFENEVHDLFGVQIKDIVIDFGGHFYAVAQKEPMTILSPEQLAAREKAKKIAAAQAAKAAKEAKEA